MKNLSRDFWIVGTIIFFNNAPDNLQFISSITFIILAIIFNIWGDFNDEK